ncbi:two pore domain potassium channel family protein [Arthrobacter echini]|uniref:Two pore domain potassium channel family protein n=2 Tax=Arthrobacter echini TaxID=1529066 RepID=A0A4S5E0I3_9MICC|nr:potassium channel family protein [Arthrobacter echini]THJ64811.1 two pore domain potassium channel family protein [Arthrobacter echini]TYC97130.1 two pore domain potassium channel family protein [Arthrobacter echini]
MEWIFAVLGIIVIGVGLRDVFHTLLHPSGEGELTKWCMRTSWQVSKRMGSKAVAVAGPLGIVIVILLWTVLQVLGWTLIYYPHIPQGFVYADGVDPSRYPDFIEAIYVSMVALSTLGFGDVIAVDPWIRAFSPVEALAGFALLTAAVSWFMQLYPALARRRAIGIHLTILRGANYVQDFSQFSPDTASRVLENVTNDLVQVRVDLTQTGESYYFRESTATTSLAASLSYAVALSEQAQAHPDAGVRASGVALQKALQDLSNLMAETFGLTGSSVEDKFRSYASDHGYDYES